MSSGTDTATAGGSRIRAAQPTRAVQRAIRRYRLNPTGLGPEASQAWYALISPVFRASSRSSDEAHDWATAFLSEAQPILDALADYDDAEATLILGALRERWTTMRSKTHQYDLRAQQVVGWIQADEPAGAADCIRIVPPPDVEIQDRVGTRSYQKRVFRAIWAASGRRQEIVLKEFLDDAAAVIPREMQAYPLSMLHPNIIQTYRLEN